METYKEQKYTAYALANTFSDYDYATLIVLTHASVKRKLYNLFVTQQSVKFDQFFQHAQSK